MSMDVLTFDLNRTYGDFKPMNAVNDGPTYNRRTDKQTRSTMKYFKEAHIPYARNHDAAWMPEYGGEHTVDVSAVFPNFDADPYDPASYDFVCTDETIEVTALAGTATFYRLGQKIEPMVKKYHTEPPKDFKKWAVICEHIIRHCNEGFADGHDYGIEYWEIWNEPDGGKATWGGTPEQFYDFYETAAKHLKKCFPHLKIGGPSLCWGEDWAEAFLAEMSRREVPMDFFSWHCYCDNPEYMEQKAARIRNMMDRYGYTDAESHLNEWNYIEGWGGDDYVRSILAIHGMKGAAFTMACMTQAQKSSVDMMMYYDARPRSVFNGMFDFYTQLPLKGYYPFLWFSGLVGTKEVRSNENVPHLYSLCSVDENGRARAIVTYFTREENAADKTVRLDFGRAGHYEVRTLDEEHTNECTESEQPIFVMKPNSCLFVCEM